MKRRKSRGRGLVFYANGERHLIVTGIIDDPALDWAFTRMAYLEIVGGLTMASTFSAGQHELSINPMFSYLSPGAVLVTTKHFKSYEENGKQYNYDNLRGSRLNRRFDKLNVKKSKINQSLS
jgi:hypothetical protein